MGHLKSNLLFIIILCQYIEVTQHWHFLYFGSLSQDLEINEQEQQLCSLALKHNDNASRGFFFDEEEEERCLDLEHANT